MSMKKQLTTKTGKQCLSRCIPPNTDYVHPVTLETITTKKYVCATHPWINEEGEILNFDECDPSEIIYDNLEDNILIPQLDFNYETFLKYVYDIKSFLKTIKWVRNNYNLPYETIERVLNASWYVYFNEIRIEFKKTIEFYVDFLKKKWIDDIKQLLNIYPEKIIDAIIKSNDNLNLIVEKSIKKTIKDNENNLNITIHNIVKENVYYYVNKIAEKINKNIDINNDKNLI